MGLHTGKLVTRTDDVISIWTSAQQSRVRIERIIHVDTPGKNSNHERKIMTSISRRHGACLLPHAHFTDRYMRGQWETSCVSDTILHEICIEHHIACFQIAYSVKNVSEVSMSFHTRMLHALGSFRDAQGCQDEDGTVRTRAPLALRSVGTTLSLGCGVRLTYRSNSAAHT